MATVRDRCQEMGCCEWLVKRGLGCAACGTCTPNALVGAVIRELDGNRLGLFRHLVETGRYADDGGPQRHAPGAARCLTG